MKQQYMIHYNNMKQHTYLSFLFCTTVTCFTIDTVISFSTWVRCLAKITSQHNPMWFGRKHSSSDFSCVEIFNFTSISTPKHSNSSPLITLIHCWHYLNTDFSRTEDSNWFMANLTQASTSLVEYSLFSITITFLQQKRESITIFSL